MVDHSIPFLFALNYYRQKIEVEIKYVTVAEPEITRTLRLARVVATTLPISVNVEDFFRGNRSCINLSAVVYLTLGYLGYFQSLPFQPRAINTSAYQPLKYSFLTVVWKASKS
jgi:hypothetical protein